MEAQSREKWQGLGYEFVSQVQGRVQTTLTFRKAKATTPKWVWIVVGAVIVGLGILIAIMATLENAGKEAAAPIATPTQTAVEPSARAAAEPTSEPAPSEPAPAPVVAQVSDAEVLAFFNSFFDERKTAGVLFAQAITNVTFSDRVLRVTFDASVVGMNWASFDAVTPFGENYANFAITPIAFNSGIAPNVRASMDAVETFQVDGTPRGTLTTTQVVEMNELD